MRAQDAYDELLRRSREETLLASCAELLGWDEETYLPPGGVGHRANVVRAKVTAEAYSRLRRMVPVANAAATSARSTNPMMVGLHTASAFDLPSGLPANLEREG